MADTQSVAGQKLLIGWASRDITPNRTVNVVGQLRARVSDHVVDALTTTALALSSEGGDEQAIIVSADIAVPEQRVLDACRQNLRDRLADFDVSLLVISATHTHTSPAQVPLVRYPTQAPHVMTVDEYTEILVRGICDAAAEAWQSRKPGAVAWGCGQAVVGFNRRVVYLDGTAKMYGKTDDENFSHIEGSEDHGIDMLFTFDADRRPTGMVLNLACPSQSTEGESFISADFWHDAREEIRRRHGSGLFILPQCSAAGDQSPHPLMKKPAEARMLALKGFMAEGRNVRRAERIEIGMRIAAAVDDVLPPASTDIRDRVVFRHKVAHLDLPRRMITEEELAFVRQTVETNQAKLASFDPPDPAGREYSQAFVLTRRFQNVIDRYERQQQEKTLRAETHIIRLGDIAFATNRFEYFLDYGLRIKARSKAIQTFVVQLAGEGSYLPTERALKNKTYGATIENSLVTPEGGQMLVNETVRLINEMFASQ